MSLDPFKVSFQSSNAPGPDDPGHWMFLKHASNLSIFILVLYGFILLAAIGFGFWCLLPEVMDASIASAGTEASESTAGNSERMLSSWEKKFQVLVVCSGALGGLVHLFSSLGIYVGGRQLLRSWLLFYYFRPVVGGILALFVYFVLRMGVLLPTNAQTPQQINIYGVLAFSALSGLFSKQAIEKLAEIFDILFQKVRTATSEATAQQLFRLGTRDDLSARLSPQQVAPRETFSEKERVEDPADERTEL